MVEQQADVCVRLNPHALPLWDKRSKSFPLLESLAGLQEAGDVNAWPVWVHSGQHRIAGRLCAIRKSREAMARTQKRLAEKRGKVVSPETWQYAQYVLVFTTLSSASATARQVLECYRLRWQVELTFKRLKSIAQLGHVPKHDDQSTRAWLYGKLFVALLSQKLARVGRTISPWGYSLPETENPQPVA